MQAEPPHWWRLGDGRSAELEESLLWKLAAAGISGSHRTKPREPERHRLRPLCPPGSCRARVDWPRGLRQ